MRATRPSAFILKHNGTAVAETQDGIDPAGPERGPLRVARPGNPSRSPDRVARADLRAQRHVGDPGRGVRLRGLRRAVSAPVAGAPPLGNRAVFSGSELLLDPLHAAASVVAGEPE